MLMPAFIVSPGLLQKVYGARDDRAVRIGVGLNALALFVYASVPAAARPDRAGAASRVCSNRELALPTLLMHDLPFWVGALGLAAVFSAEVSAGDAILFMLATSLSQDLYKRFINPSATDGAVLSVARGASVAGGRLGVGLAMMSEDDRRRAQRLLHAAEREPVRAHRRRPVHAPCAARWTPSPRSPAAYRWSWQCNCGAAARRSGCSRRRCAGWRRQRRVCGGREPGSRPVVGHVGRSGPAA